ncbi:MAG: hypothetical protein ACLR23_04330 [Clostridia bacterium]
MRGFSMGLLSIVFLGIATNLDNLFIGIAFGARKRNITLLQNVLIASISAITAYVACLFAVLISSHFSVYANIAGSIFLLLLGFIGLLKPTPSNSEVSVDRPLHIKETALLGGSLAINCLPVAIGAGSAGISPSVLAPPFFFSAFLSWQLGSTSAKSLHPAAMNAR